MRNTVCVFLTAHVRLGHQVCSMSGCTRKHSSSSSSGLCMSQSFYYPTITVFLAQSLAVTIVQPQTQKPNKRHKQTAATMITSSLANGAKLYTTQPPRVFKQRRTIARPVQAITTQDVGCGDASKYNHISPHLPRSHVFHFTQDGPSTSATADKTASQVRAGM